MDHFPLLNVLAYLGAAVIAVPIFRRLGLGAILGYLAAGALIGPQGIHVIDHPEDALHFAEFGVVMLLFVIGLELNPEKLWSMRKLIAFLGGGQLFLCAGLIAWSCYFVFDFSVQIAVLIGLTLALSSTAFAVQLMDEQGVMGSHLGRKGFSILLLQDMAVIPILLLVDFWAPPGNAEDSSAVAWWLGPLAIIGVLLFGRFCLNPCLQIISRYGSREVFTAAALLIVLGTATLIQSLGLSMGMGAFLAGIILANSSFRHQLEADIEPFKGLLLGLFFIAVGMTLDLKLLTEHPLLIISLAVALMAIKTFIITVLVHFRSCNWKESLLLGLMLSQGGEFAFVVMSKSLSLNIIDQGIADYLVMVVGVSMALTSPLVMLAKQLFRDNEKNESPNEEIVNEEPEVIIAGFGRFGQIVGRILSANHIHFAALDKDAHHVEFVRSFGNKIYFGDATRSDLLEAAGIDHARVIVVAVDGMEDSLKIIRWVKKTYPDITIVARAHNRTHAYQLTAEEVIVVREMLESSLVAANETLMSLGFTEGQAISKVEIFRNHDQLMLEKAVAHKDDMKVLMAMAKEGRIELEQLFKQDENI